MKVTKVTKMMDVKEFSKVLEKRTRKFAVSIIQLSSTLPNTPEGRVIRNQITKSGLLVQITVRPIEREARQISKIRLRFVKAKQVRPNIG